MSQDASMRQVKVMPDYHCWPLWHAGGGIGNIDPASLPLSPALRADLLTWADAFDATLDPADPASSGFASAEALGRFDHWGRSLAERVAKELSGTHRVLYFSVVGRVVEPVPSA